MEKSSGLGKLQLEIKSLTVERDALAILSEKYKDSFTILSRAYATANAQLTQALELSETLTLQYRDIARDRAESITHLLHGSRTVVGNTLRGQAGAADQSPIAKLESIIVKREQKLNAGVRNPSFIAARVLTCFVDGRFSERHSNNEQNANYEGQLEYLAQLDKEIGRLMSSRAYLLRAKLAAKARNPMKSQTGQRK